MGFILKILPVTFVLISIWCYYFLSKDVELIDYCKQNTKTLVFNEELCSDILEGNIIVNKSYFHSFINLFSPKSVFWGKFNNISVVLKTVVSSNHVKKMESDFQRIFSDISKESNNLLLAQMEVYSLINIPLGTTQLPKLRLCPFNSSVERFLNRIPGSSNYGVHDYFKLWTILYSNPEPLILKLLDPKVWPVPEYFGSCGQVIAVEDCGLTLTNYHDSDWNTRANISHQLLENALNFTFQDPDFAFYLTDLSPDNIAVTQEGIVKYIDLEHIILVDKHSEGSEDWLVNHTSNHYDCNNCIKFEADEICSHHVSDHNIYAVCKEIFSDSELLPGGFLHSVPTTQLHLISHFIEECIRPKYITRFESADRIMYLLKKYI